VERERAPEVVVVGHATVDTNVLPDGSRVLSIGGPPTYSGLSLKALGRRVGVFSNVSEDRWSDVRALYSAGGVDVKGLLARGERMTTFENIYDEWGGRRQRCTAVAPPLREEDFPAFYAGAKCFYVSPVAGEVSCELLRFLKRLGKPVVLDPQGMLRRIGEGGEVLLHLSSDFLDSLRFVDVVKVGKDEIEAFPMENREILHFLREKGSRVVIVTRAGEPVLYLDEEGFLEVEVPRVEVKDPTGAGDVYGAALVSEYLERGDWRFAARFAAVAASLKIRFEALRGFPSREDVLRVLGQRLRV